MVCLTILVMSTLRTRLGATLLPLVFLTLPACADTGDDLGESDFRDIPTGPGSILEPDTTIYHGSSASDDCVIWDVTDGTTLDPQTGEVLQQITDGVFYDRDGIPVCVMDGNELSSIQIVRSAANPDDVVFTVRGPFVFEGELNLAGKNKWQRIKEMRSKLLFTFFFEHVFEGPVWQDNILVTADTNLMIQIKQRKLQIASLITGECGGPGLEAPTPGHAD